MKHISVGHIRAALIVLSVIMIAIGVAMGEHMSVLQKSIRICLECIGIG